MGNDMIEPSPELAESAAEFQASNMRAVYSARGTYEQILRDRLSLERRPGFDSVQHYHDVVYLLNLLDRERR